MKRWIRLSDRMIRKVRKATAKRTFKSQWQAEANEMERFKRKLKEELVKLAP